MIVTKLLRKGRARDLETLRQAKARAEARTALTPLLHGLEPQAAERMTDAALDEAITLHARAHGADVTAVRLQKISGAIWPPLKRSSAVEAGEAALRKARAA